MTANNELIDKIRRSLQMELPGTAAQLKMAPSFRGNLMDGVDRPPFRSSAVLAPIFVHNNQVCTLLIKRPEYNGIHSGQICFPGGKLEPADRSLQDTALRETFEEIGVEPQLFEILGSISPLDIPVSNTRVTPFLGLMKGPLALNLNTREAEYAIVVPLADLKRPENIKERNITVAGRNIVAPFYDIQNEFVWGATAMIISEFTELF